MGRNCTQPWKFGHSDPSFLFPSDFFTTRNSLYSASQPWEDLFYTCTLASVGVHAVREALRSHVKSCWTWQGGSAFKGRCRVLSYVILWDGPLKQNCVMGLALKGLACLSGLNGNDVKTRQEHKPGLLSSTVTHTHKGDQQRGSGVLPSVNHKCLL